MPGPTACDPDLLTAPEVAEVLRCSVRTVRRMTYTGGLPHLRIGRRVLYPAAAIAQWVRSNTAQRAQPPIVPIPYIAHQPTRFDYRTPAPATPRPPVVLDRNGCVTGEGLG